MVKVQLQNRPAFRMVLILESVEVKQCPANAPERRDCVEYTTTIEGLQFALLLQMYLLT